MGRMEGLGFALRDDATVASLTDEAITSHEIEGEHLNRDQVRSSIARRLGIDIGALEPTDRHVEGVAEMMLDATQRYDRPLTKKRLFAWHAALFPTRRSGMRSITVGAWRKGPVRVISGPIGREKIHFEGPSAARLAKEMTVFLRWFNGPAETDLILKAGIAHLWFVTIHPLDDGNGRIARVLTDLLLARSEQSSQRFYSVSAQIQRERKQYYAVLEKTQKGTLDITPWMNWYLDDLERAFESAEAGIAAVLTKARFWERHAGATLNDRQRAMVNALLNGIEGKMTSSKWAKMTKTSPDTALRDIEKLIALGILERDPAGGRSTSYSLTAMKTRTAT
jgi:Fic family protein